MDFDETFRNYSPHCPIKNGIGHNIWKFVKQQNVSRRGGGGERGAYGQEDHNV